MNSLDIVVLLLALGYVWSGFRQGLAVNLSGMLGLVLLGVLAFAAVPKIFGDHGSDEVGTALMALGIVVGAAAIGQAVGTVVGSDIRRGFRSQPMRWLDALGGSVLGAIVVLVASWALGYAVSGADLPYLSNAARSSAVLRTVDRVMPDGATEMLQSFNRVIDANLFPRYIDPFVKEEIINTGPPDEATLALPAVQQARKSVYKIVGNAVCGRGIEGSGWVFAPNRIMTNAHVVAGVRDPLVITDSGRELEAEVVLFDPKIDLAVLRVNGLNAPVLELDTTAGPGDDAAILGYPGDGPFDARAARIRQQITLQSPDIYGYGQLERETYSIRGLVRSGNSGGPLISPAGKVLGIIFAASLTDKMTGYAITDDQAADALRAGRTAGAEVSTGACS